MDEQIELRPILEALTRLPPLNLGYSADVEARLPEIEGGLSVALAHAFRIIDPKLKNPQTAQWEQAIRMFDLLL